MTVQKEEEFKMSIDQLEKEVNDGNSIIGSNLKRLVVSRYTESGEYENLYLTFFSESKDSDTYSINHRVYYFIDDKNTIRRDVEKSPRKYLLLNSALEDMIDRSKSYSGFEIKDAINKEFILRSELTDGDKAEEFFNPPIEELYKSFEDKKFTPKDNIYYFFSYNTAGNYFIKRDIEKSPRVRKSTL